MTLGELSGPWSLDLEQLRTTTRVALHLANQLDNGAAAAGAAGPRVVFSVGASIDSVLSKSMRKQLRRARNKITAAGLEMTIGFDRGRAITVR